MRQVRWMALTALAVLTVLAGCGTPAPAPTTADPGAPAPTASDPTTVDPTATDPQQPAVPTADLTITLDESGDGTTRTFTLTCDPVGGDHPDPDAACRALADAGPEPLRPVPRNVGCTDLWGGPQVATVRGTVDGQRVDTRFDRTNGCEIGRWDALAPLLGSRGGA